MSDNKKHKLWGGRFGEATDALMEHFNASIGFDKRLAEVDIKASKAHAAMMARQGIISPKEAALIKKGLDQVLAELKAGQLEFSESLEDIHTHVEVRLGQIIGEAAGKLNTARSRNDQIATDLRLWIMQAGKEMDQALREFQKALVSLAERHKGAVMPGYTHLQRAQPVLLAHHLLAYYEMADRDRARLADCLRRTAVLPLGAAALAGTTFPLDPDSVAAELNMQAPCANSLDAVSDRDFAAEFLFGLTLVQVHLSRLAEELVIWSSQEFGFVTLSEAFSTGSSIMPQKKNPDAAELIRAKTGRVLGDLVALATMLKGQPLAYNKDLQEDKEPVFDAFDTVISCLRVLAPLLATLTVHEDRLKAAAEAGFLNATELADYLALKGVPFRQAHEIAGRAVRLAEKTGRTLPEISLKEYQDLSDVIKQDVFTVLDTPNAVNRRTSPGGTASAQVEAALKEARKRLWSE